MSASLVIFSAPMLSGAFLHLRDGAFMDNGKELSLVVGTTLPVAFSEEMMYRKAVPGASLEHHFRLRAVVYGAVLFSLLHAVNVPAGTTFLSIVLPVRGERKEKGRA